MIENSIGLYAAFKAKDARFDGRFFVGISSTGIYNIERIQGGTKNVLFNYISVTHRNYNISM